MIDAINSELTSSETLLWSGKPKQGIVFRLGDFFLIPFSLMWGGFALFWEFMALRIPQSGQRETLLFPLFGIPFVLIGLYIMIGRFFFDAFRRRRTEYGLTDERALIITHLVVKKVQSVNLRTLSDLTFTEHSDGTGTLLLGPINPKTEMLGPTWPSYRSSPCFELISTPREVYERVRAAQARRNG